MTREGEASARNKQPASIPVEDIEDDDEDDDYLPEPNPLRQDPTEYRRLKALRLYYDDKVRREQRQQSSQQLPELYEQQNEARQGNSYDTCRPPESHQGPNQRLLALRHSTYDIPFDRDARRYTQKFYDSILQHQQLMDQPEGRRLCLHSLKDTASGHLRIESMSLAEYMRHTTKLMLAESENPLLQSGSPSESSSRDRAVSETRIRHFLEETPYDGTQKHPLAGNTSGNQASPSLRS